MSGPPHFAPPAIPTWMAGSLGPEWGSKPIPRGFPSASVWGVGAVPDAGGATAEILRQIGMRAAGGAIDDVLGQVRASAAQGAEAAVKPWVAKALALSTVSLVVGGLALLLVLTRKP